MAASGPQKVVGKLSFSLDESNVIGRGRHTAVYKGSYEGTTEVAIKRFIKSQRSNVSAIEADRLRQYDRHENIARYYVTEQDDLFYYVGMELCNGTLEHLIRGRYNGRSVGPDKEILKQLASAVEYLTSRGLINRNINPNTILISYPDGADPPKIKLVDFSISREVGEKELENSGTILGNEWTAPELILKNQSYTAAVDVFSTGCVFAYFLSKGRHPFGVVSHQTLNISLGHVIMPREITDGAAIDLITKMLKWRSTERITIKEVSFHPYFWDEEKSLIFIQSACAILETDPSLVKVLESGKEQIFGGRWPNHLTERVRADLFQGMLRMKNKVEVTTSVFFLLKAIRNKWEHFGNASGDAKREYGDPPEQYFKYWSCRFPRLLTHTWVVMGAKRSDPAMQEFYADIQLP